MKHIRIIIFLLMASLAGYGQCTISGGSSGSVDCVNDLELTSTAEVDLVATANGTNEVLSSDAMVLLGGVLSLSVTYTPVSGDSYTIVTGATGISGTFSTVNLPAFAGLCSQVVYNTNSVVVKYNALPDAPVVNNTFVPTFPLVSGFPCAITGSVSNFVSGYIINGLRVTQIGESSSFSVNAARNYSITFTNPTTGCTSASTTFTVIPVVDIYANNPSLPSNTVNIGSTTTLDITVGTNGDCSDAKIGALDVTINLGSSFEYASTVTLPAGFAWTDASFNAPATPSAGAQILYATNTAIIPEDNSRTFQLSLVGIALCDGQVTVTVAPDGITDPSSLNNTGSIDYTILPVVDDPNNLIKCSDEPFPVTFVSTAGGASGTTYDWVLNTLPSGLTTTGATSGTGNISAYSFNNISAGSLTATFTVTPKACSPVKAGTPQTFTITVNPEPVLLDITDLTGPNAVCSDSPINVTFANATSSIPATATSYAWSITSPVSLPSGLTPSATGGTGNISGLSFENVGSSAVTVTITVTAKSSGTSMCEGNPQSFDITINPEPVIAPMVVNNVCSATPIGVQIPDDTNGPSISSFTISVNAPGLTAGSGNALLTGSQTNIGLIANDVWINTTSGSLPVVYTVTPISGGCSGTPFTITINVNDGQPDLAITISPIENAGQFATPATANLVLLNVNELSNAPAGRDIGNKVIVRVTKITNYTIALENATSGLPTSPVNFNSNNSSDWMQLPGNIADPYIDFVHDTFTCMEASKICLKITRGTTNISTFAFNARVRNATYLTPEITTTNNFASAIIQGQ
jgi:PKD-like domain